MASTVPLLSSSRSAHSNAHCTHSLCRLVICQAVGSAPHPFGAHGTKRASQCAPSVSECTECDLARLAHPATLLSPERLGHLKLTILCVGPPAVVVVLRCEHCIALLAR
eukprot:4889759-Prymnesium_polylepis.1